MDRQQRIESLFTGALEIPSAEREAWLLDKCGSDSGILHEVLSLLQNRGGNGLQPGARLGAYEIREPIGRGGMGEVYRAYDLNLRRDVAIKVLPLAFANDPERLARFTREARVLASMNHPNIASIYGVEEGALVMELVDGATLAERIRTGPLRWPEAMPVAKQIAEALEYAHEKGVIHRDLKPANIKLTSDGRVKVLDFGLAKALYEPTVEADRSSSPTLTIGTEGSGVILGTAAYMSPEQARGKPVDKRTDIWAFGCVLFELLTGKRAFPGDSVPDILASVTRDEPDFRDVPPHLHSVVTKCFRKDPRTRWRDIGDVQLALEESPLAPAAPAGRQPQVPWLIAAGLLLSTIFTAVLLWRSTRFVPNILMRLSVDLGPLVNTNTGANAILSPDGTRIVFLTLSADGKSRLAMRHVSESQPVILAGTDNSALSPFFSPNGEWIGFFADGKLKKIPVQGGAAVLICDANNPRGASWGDDDHIVFSPGLQSGLVRVPASGGVPKPLTQLRPGETSHRWPQVLPGARAVLFAAGSGRNWENANIEIQSLETGQRRSLHRGGSYAKYMAGGFLLYLHEGGVFARPFDLNNGEVTGSAVPLLENVTYSPVTGSAQFDVIDSPSGHGTLIYRSGEEAQTVVYSLDQTGDPQRLVSEPAVYFNPRFSPDGKRLVVSQFSGNLGLWILDLERRNFSRLTSIAGDNRAVWSPDGRHIAYSSALADLSWVAADASSPPTKLLESAPVALPNSFSPDGKRLAYSMANPETGLDIWMLPIEGSNQERPQVGTPEGFLRTQANEGDPAFSPDGRWVAYSSDESGKYEVYVRPYPGPGSKWQISIAGGRLPMWTQSGRELAYAAPDGRLMVVGYESAGNSFRAGQARLWSPRPVTLAGSQNIDLSPDGKHLAALLGPASAAPPRTGNSVMFLENIVDELKRRATAAAK